MKLTTAIIGIAAALTLTGCGNSDSDKALNSGDSATSAPVTATATPHASAQPSNAPVSASPSTGMTGVDNAADGAGKAVEDAADGVGNAVKDVTDGAGNAVKDVTDGLTGDNKNK